MPNKEFLEEYPLLRKYKMKVPATLRELSSTAIKMYCSNCHSAQTYNKVNLYWEDYEVQNVQSNNCIVRAIYCCASCKMDSYTFYIKIDSELNYVQKVGQNPPWEIKMDKGLEKSLYGHASTFKKGLVCESQNYGIGAFAYYRRIVEEVIDELLTSIADIIQDNEKEKYLRALEETKKTRVAQEKIDLVKDLLPAILRPDGLNPLAVLHSKLSEGLHAESDEECLEVAHSIREIMTFLINQVIKSKESSKAFTESMRKILDKKSSADKW
jgi:hypothetical protein